MVEVKIVVISVGSLFAFRRSPTSITCFARLLQLIVVHHLTWLVMVQSGRAVFSATTTIICVSIAAILVVISTRGVILRVLLNVSGN